VESGVVKVSKIDTSVNPADSLTKALPSSKFELSLGLVGM